MRATLEAVKAQLEEADRRLCAALGIGPCPGGGEVVGPPAVRELRVELGRIAGRIEAALHQSQAVRDSFR